ncbi:MAG: TRAP transporter large permease [Proteobacteria bacterium]|nr:TRAP transporter large permease [Pseudomonadota bacterium]
MMATALIALGVFIAFALPVAGVLGLLGFVLDQFTPVPTHVVIGETAWQHGTGFILVAVPLFILMGEMLLLSGVADRMYNAVLQWIARLPGGLMHANIASCALFAATSGSSVATAATVGTVAIPQIEKYGYNERLFLGSLAAGGTLGILIPPSINMIIYGVLTDTSIPRLYLAGFFPGIVLAFLFMLIVLAACLLRPGWGGKRVETTREARIAGLPHLLPPLGLFLVVVGSIYVGIATPTEAAAIGVLISFGLAAGQGRLTLPVLHRALEATMRTTSMILLIIVAAYFLNFSIASTGLIDRVNVFILGLGWTPLQTMIGVIAVYLVLGCIMDVLAMMVLTLPIITPVVVHLGYDPVWFGIIIMLVCEAALITPPIGMNCYVIQAVRGRGLLDDVMIGIVPFVVAIIIMFAILLAFPDLALWLPTLMMR